MADFLNGLFFSEFLVDNAGSGATDTDGDGTINKSDEYIELGNVSGAPISLDGYQVWSEQNGLLYSFGPGDVIGDGEAATIVGNYGGSTPGFYDAGNAEGSDFLQDGEGTRFDSIFLVNSTTGEYIVFSYGDPPRAPTLPTGFPGTTQVGTGETMTSNGPNGIAFARDANGTFVETAPTPGTPDVACFAEDTLILTRHGERAVGDLRPGDMVVTCDDGLQPVLGVCAQHLPVTTLLHCPTLRPLSLQGTGGGPNQTLRLSPAHAVLHRSARAEALFGTPEVLLRARHLQHAGLATPELPRAGVTYVHLLLAEHALVMANGVWSETFLNGGPAHDPAAIRAQWRMADDLTLAEVRHRHTARTVLRGFEARVLLSHPTARAQHGPGRTFDAPPARAVFLPHRRAG